MDRFWNRVQNTGGCWEWLGCTDTSGYGWLRGRGKKNTRAHRLSWELLNGEIPDGLCVLHKCDNRICVNPDHLFLGTRAENNADCRAKGRNIHPGKPPIHGDAKVMAARALVAMGLAQKEVARRLGCSQPMVSSWYRGASRNGLVVRRVAP